MRLNGTDGGLLEMVLAFEKEPVCRIGHYLRRRLRRGRSGILPSLICSSIFSFCTMPFSLRFFERNFELDIIITCFTIIVILTIIFIFKYL